MGFARLKNKVRFLDRSHAIRTLATAKALPRIVPSSVAIANSNNIRKGEGSRGGVITVLSISTSIVLICK